MNYAANGTWNCAVICPRECPDPRTEHCCGDVDGKGRARCWFCGRYMPLAEAISFWPDEGESALAEPEVKA